MVQLGAWWAAATASLASPTVRRVTSAVHFGRTTLWSMQMGNALTIAVFVLSYCLLEFDLLIKLIDRIANRFVVTSTTLRSRTDRRCDA